MYVCLTVIKVVEGYDFLSFLLKKKQEEGTGCGLLAEYKTLVNKIQKFWR